MIVRLPIPPSSNNLFFNLPSGRGRCRTARYHRWLAQADKLFLTQKKRGLTKVSGTVSVTILIPFGSRSDADNMTKAVCDYLVSRELTDDDRHYTRVTVERADLPPGECEVVVEAAG